MIHVMRMLYTSRMRRDTIIICQNILIRLIDEGNQDRIEGHI